jgi:hypothetical protein
MGYDKKECPLSAVPPALQITLKTSDRSALVSMQVAIFFLMQKSPGPQSKSAWNNGQDRTAVGDERLILDT